ncbi:hypothetical protein FJU30_26610, partial [Affinibrenneria salicis]
MISQTELQGQIDVRIGLPAGAVAGDTLSVTDGTTAQTVVLTAEQISNGYIDTAFANPGEGQTIKVDATLHDQYGNTSDTGSDSARVDTLAGDSGAAPVVTITEDANNDGVISQSELQDQIDVRVGLPAGAVAGDTLSVTDGATQQNVVLTAEQISNGYVDTAFANPGEGQTIQVDATLHDQYGNTSDTGSDSARIDTLAGADNSAPVVTISEDANNDGVISQTELQGQIDVRVGLPAGAVAGDTLNVTDGTTAQTVVLTAEQISNGYIDTAFANPGEGSTIQVDAVLHDQYGNVSDTGSDSARVDTLAGADNSAPVVTISEDANNDGVISQTELQGQIDVRVGLPAGAVAGDTLSITDGTTAQNVVLTAENITNGYIDTAFASPGEGQTIQVDAVLHDQYGNVSDTGSDSARIDTLSGADNSAPVVTITEDANNDGVISQTELQGQIDVRVGLPAGAVAGDTLSVTDGTTAQNVVLTAENITNGYIDTAFANPGEGQTIQVDAVLHDQYGNVSDTGSDSARVDTLAGADNSAPVVTITEDANNDGVISQTELQGQIDVRVGLPAGAVAGDTLSVTDGTTAQNVVLTAENISTGYVDTAFANPGEGSTIQVDAVLHDQYGNVSDTGSDSARVDTLAGDTGAAPVVTITEDANNDGVISQSELQGQIDVRVGLPAGAVAGDTLSVTDGTTAQTVVLTAENITNGYIDTAFANPGEGQTIQVDAVLHDQYGNVSDTGSDSARVDTLAGDTGAAPVVTITEDANNDGVISQSELQGQIDVRVGLPAGAVAGDTLSVTDGTTAQTVVLTAENITNGYIDTAFANPGEGQTIQVDAVLHDQYGNVSDTGSDSARVDTLAGDTGAAPVVTITEDANNDGVISQSELQGQIDVRVGLPAGAVAGDTLSVTDGATQQNVVLTAEQISNGYVDTAFASPGEGQ